MTTYPIWIPSLQYSIHCTHFLTSHQQALAKRYTVGEFTKGFCELMQQLCDIDKDTLDNLTIIDQFTMALQLADANIGDVQTATINCPSCENQVTVRLSVNDIFQLIEPILDKSFKFTAKVADGVEGCMTSVRYTCNAPTLSFKMRSATNSSINHLGQWVQEIVTLEGRTLLSRNSNKSYNRILDAISFRTATKLEAEIRECQELQQALGDIVLAKVQCGQCNQDVPVSYRPANIDQLCALFLESYATNLYQECFTLVYDGRFALRDVESLTPGDRRIYLDLLQDRLKKSQQPIEG